MAQAQIIGGARMGQFLWNMVNTVYSGSVCGISGRSLEGNVASVQILSEEQKKSFLKATATGLVGAALAGPVGAVAGVVAGGNHKELLFSCQLHSGGQFVAKGDARIFDLLLAESMKPRRDPAPSAPLGPRGRSLVESGDFPPGCEVILNNGTVKLYQGAATPLLLSGKVSGIEITPSSLTPQNAPSGVRFSCRLSDGRALVAQGDTIVYETLRSQQFKSGQSLGAWVFVLFLFLLVGLAFYFQAPLTEFISPGN